MTFFCSLPFKTLEVADNGAARPCCKFVSATAIPIQTYFTSQLMRQVKQQLLDNTAPAECKRCVDEERLSGHSLRITSENIESHETEIRAANSPDYFNITDLLILTGNTCNLLCLPCSNSSYIRQLEMQKMGLLAYIPQTRTSTVQLTHIPNIGNLTRVTLLGGEPFADKKTWDLIDQLIASGQSQQVRLDLNTNMTLITRPALIKLKENFKEVMIKASIDGVGACNEYLRYPSNWQEITQSVDLVKELGITLLLVATVSNLALIHFDQLIAWANKNNIDNVYMSKVMFPQILRFDRIPAALKQKLLKKYTELYDSFKGIEETRFLIKTCMEMCSSPGCSREEFTATVEWLKKHDQHRGTDYTGLWPEFILDHE